MTPSLVIFLYKKIVYVDFSIPLPYLSIQKVRLCWLFYTKMSSLMVFRPDDFLLEQFSHTILHSCLLLILKSSSLMAFLIGNIIVDYFSYKKKFIVDKSHQRWTCCWLLPQKSSSLMAFLISNFTADQKFTLEDFSFREVYPWGLFLLRRSSWKNFFYKKVNRFILSLEKYIVDDFSYTKNSSLMTPSIEKLIVDVNLWWFFL